MQSKEFKIRRYELLKAIGNNNIAIVFAAKEQGVNTLYRQNSDFYYLSGFIEPESIAVLIPSSIQSKNKFILFNRENDPSKEVWSGSRAGQKGACRDFGADQSFAITEVDNILPRLLANHNYSKVYSNADVDDNFDPRIKRWLSKKHLKSSILLNLGDILHEMRLKKSKIELKSIRKAVEITTMGHLRAMQKCVPNAYEYELEAELLYEFTRRGGHPAFPSICASGINACTLHYSKNNKRMASGEMVLVDAGAMYNYYSADVSRTLPVNGKFTRKQRTIYEIVLSAQIETIKQIRPGVRWDYLQSTAQRIITAGLVDAKLLKGNIESLLLKQKFKSFFMHIIGHWLGLDIHDVGKYRIDDKWRVLEPGMVLTIEPGIYDPKSLRMGVRIEDNVLVTKNGCEVLTSEIPKTVAEIEKMMAKRR